MRFRVELSLPPGAPVDHLPADGRRELIIIQVRGGGRVTATAVDQVVHVWMRSATTHLAAHVV